MADFTAEQRRTMARNGQALSDGSFPIPDASHLDKAIRAVGRASNHAPETVRRHIVTRAKALGATSQLPDSWNSDGTVTKSEPFDVRVPLWKDDAKRIVYGVVLTPDLEDSQEDIVAADDIEKAAHAWLAEYRGHDIQHDGVPADIVPVESFIAPVDFQVTNADGETQTVLKGSWVLASRIDDADAWSRVQKDELTGWSITGSGTRYPVPAA